jgi:hypothetical protein
MMWARPLGFEWEGYLLGDEGEEIPPMGVRPEPERGGEEPTVEIPEELPILPLRGRGGLPPDGSPPGHRAAPLHPAGR